MVDGVADVVVDRVELLLEIGDVAREPSGKRPVDAASAASVGFHADHLDDLPPPTDELGEVDPLRFPKRPCLRDGTRSAKRAITSASSVSVLAKRPIARAKSRIWRGLTTQSGSPTPARAAATVASKPPVASSTTRATDSPLEADDQVVHPLALSWNTEFALA